MMFGMVWPLIFILPPPPKIGVCEYAPRGSGGDEGGQTPLVIFFSISPLKIDQKMEFSAVQAEGC